MIESLVPWSTVIFTGVTMIFVLGAGWLIQQIQLNTEQAALAQTRAADEARERLAELRVLERGLGTLLTDTRKELQSLREQPEPATAEQARSLGGELSALAETVRRMAGTAGAAPAPAPAPSAGAGAGAVEREAEVRRLLTAKARLEGELAQAQERLHDAQTQLSSQRRDNRRVEEASATTATLRRTNEQLMAELKSARLRARDMETRFEPLTLELKSLRVQMQAMVDAAQPGPGPEQAGAPVVDIGAAVQATAEKVSGIYRDQIEQMQGELSRANKDLLKINDELQRTLREKSFIEERYLNTIEADDAARLATEAA